MFVFVSSEVFCVCSLLSIIFCVLKNHFFSLDKNNSRQHSRRPLKCWRLAPALNAGICMISTELKVAPLNNMWKGINGQSVGIQGVLDDCYCAGGKCCLSGLHIFYQSKYVNNITSIHSYYDVFIIHLFTRLSLSMTTLRAVCVVWQKPE